ncbi:hypothetical protein DPMN_079513 [Dreissena polymorpha]|uniref:Uncharacterized protein n=1 Tax=Dreissena polymorpha TaxID=45954 RepID=A0A9D3YPN2_DREPO|nr:hypothetical protein DPMN_079513 [Dreissena polymorpha]
MGVQVLIPESTQPKHIRSLPRIPKNSHYSMKPLNSVKPSRALPTVPNSNLSKMDPNVKVARALPRVPKQTDIKKTIVATGRHGRALPEVPFREIGNLKHSDTSVSSRASTPRQAHNTSLNSHKSNTNHLSNGNHHVTNGHQSNNLSNNHHHHTSNGHHSNNVHANGNHVHTTNHQSHQSTNGNTTQRTLPKLPKLLQKPKPEQNRIEYMHELYKKEGDKFSDEGNYEQALKSYNHVSKLIFN